MKDKRVYSHLTTEEKSQLEMMCKDDNRNKSDFLRNLVIKEISRWLKRKKK